MRERVAYLLSSDSLEPLLGRIKYTRLASVLVAAVMCLLIGSARFTFGGPQDEANSGNQQQTATQHADDTTADIASRDVSGTVTLSDGQPAVGADVYLSI